MNGYRAIKVEASSLFYFSIGTNPRLRRDVFGPGVIFHGTIHTGSAKADFATLLEMR
jgi:hypothetical protein